jgi:hypothetical protein
LRLVHPEAFNPESTLNLQVAGKPVPVQPTGKDSFTLNAAKKGIEFDQKGAKEVFESASTDAKIGRNKTPAAPPHIAKGATPAR